MTIDATTAARWRASIIAAVLIAGGAGYWLGRPGSDDAATSANNGRKILYYYDPMVPQEKYQDPAALSSMGMATVPKYADDSDAGGAAPGVKIDPAAMQNLGIRVEIGRAHV